MSYFHCSCTIDIVMEDHTIVRLLIYTHNYKMRAPRHKNRE